MSTTVDDPPFGLVVRFTARPGAQAALAQALLRVDELLRAADGCLLHLVTRSVADGRQFWVTELFRDRAAHRSATTTSDVRRLAAEIADLLAVAPERHETRPLSTADRPGQALT